MRHRHVSRKITLVDDKARIPSSAKKLQDTFTVSPTVLPTTSASNLVTVTTIDNIIKQVPWAPQSRESCDSSYSANKLINTLRARELHSLTYVQCFLVSACCRISKRQPLGTSIREGGNAFLGPKLQTTRHKSSDEVSSSSGNIGVQAHSAFISPPCSCVACDNNETN